MSSAHTAPLFRFSLAQVPLVIHPEPFSDFHSLSSPLLHLSFVSPYPLISLSSSSLSIIFYSFPQTLLCSEVETYLFIHMMQFKRSHHHCHESWVIWHQSSLSFGPGDVRNGTLEQKMKTLNVITCVVHVEIDGHRFYHSLKKNAFGYFW